VRPSLPSTLRATAATARTDNARDGDKTRRDLDEVSKLASPEKASDAKPVKWKPGATGLFVDADATAELAGHMQPD